MSSGWTCDTCGDFYTFKRNEAHLQIREVERRSSIFGDADQPNSYLGDFCSWACLLTHATEEVAQLRNETVA